MTAEFSEHNHSLDVETSPQEVNCECQKARNELSGEVLHEHPDIVQRVEELAVAYPNFKPSLSDPALQGQAVSFLLAHEKAVQFFEPDFLIKNQTPLFLIEQLKTDLNLLEATQEETDKYDNNQGFLVIRDDLIAKHGQGTEAYLKTFQAILANPEQLTAAFLQIAASRDDIDFEGTFTSELETRTKLIQDNIAALQAMSATSPGYAAQVEQSGVDVTDRTAVQVFVLKSGFLADDAVSEEAKAGVAKKLGLPPRISTTTGSDVDDALDTTNPDGSPRFGADNPLPVRDGLAAYTRPDGVRIARVEVDGIGIREIPWQRGENGEVIGLKLCLLKI